MSAKTRASITRASVSSTVAMQHVCRSEVGGAKGETWAVMIRSHSPGIDARHERGPQRYAVVTGPIVNHDLVIEKPIPRLLPATKLWGVRCRQHYIWGPVPFQQLSDGQDACLARAEGLTSLFGNACDWYGCPAAAVELGPA